ncbi:unnamed protein product, partial [Heterotrigona itama]
MIRKCETCQREKLTRIRHRVPGFIPDTHKGPSDKTDYKRSRKVINICFNQIYYICTKQQAQTIIKKLMDHYIFEFSTTKSILIDQGSNLLSTVMMEFEEAFKIKHNKSIRFHLLGNLIRTLLKTELVLDTTLQLPSTIAATTLKSKEEVFRLWKRRHELYFARVTVIIENNKIANERNHDTSIIQKEKEKVIDRLYELNGLCEQSNYREPPKINVLKVKINKLENKYVHYKNLHLGVKRGLLNFMGNFSKTLFGTLDDRDLEIINQDIGKFFDANNKVIHM